jgi:hypothetical protein
VHILGMSINQIAGVLFLAGVVAAMIAITTPTYTSLTSSVWDVPSDKGRLQMIAAHSGAWRWSSAWWAAGSVFNVFGFGLLAVMFRRNDENILGEIAMLCFALGAILWLAAMTYRMGLEPLVIELADDANELPEWFKPIEAWSLSMMLFYLVLAYTAIGISGWAQLRSDLVPDWVGWFSLIFGTGAALSMVMGIPRLPGTDYSIFGLPILPHLPPLIMGFALLSRA